MKKITIEVSEKYGDIMSVTFIGRFGINIINVSASVYDLDKGSRFIVDENGRILQSKECDSNDEINFMTKLP